MQAALTGNPNVELSGFLLHGLLVLERGYIFTCMILAAIAAFLIDRKFYTAAVWSLIAAAFAALGLTHAYQVKRQRGRFPVHLRRPAPGALPTHTFGIAVGYLFFAAVFVSFGWWVGRRPPTPGSEAATGH